MINDMIKNTIGSYKHRAERVPLAALSEYHSLLSEYHSLCTPSHAASVDQARVGHHRAEDQEDDR